MDILRAQFLIVCKNYVNQTNYFDKYDVNEAIELPQIIVSGTPWSDSVSKMS